MAIKRKLLIGLVFSFVCLCMVRTEASAEENLPPAAVEELSGVLEVLVGSDWNQTLVRSNAFRANWQPRYEQETEESLRRELRSAISAASTAGLIALLRTNQLDRVEAHLEAMKGDPVIDPNFGSPAMVLLSGFIHHINMMVLSSMRNDPSGVDQQYGLALDAFSAVERDLRKIGVLYEMTSLKMMAFVLYVTELGENPGKENVFSMLFSLAPADNDAELNQQATILFAGSLAFSKLGQLEEALLLIKKAIEHLSAANQQWGDTLALTLFQAGALIGLNGDPEKALMFFKKVDEIMASMGENAPLSTLAPDLFRSPSTVPWPDFLDPRDPDYHLVVFSGLNPKLQIEQNMLGGKKVYGASETRVASTIRILFRQ